MAEKTQGAFLRVSTAAAAAKVITGATVADPVVVTAVAHGYSDGDIIHIEDIVGMIKLNERTFVVANPVTDSFELKGVDGTGFTAYASGGNAFKHTMIEIGEVEDISGLDGAAGEEDVTHLRSNAMEYLATLEDAGNLNLALLVIEDSGQARLRALKDSQLTTSFAWHRSNGKIAGLRAFVKTFTVNNPKNSAVRGNVQLRITGKFTWWA